VTSTTAHQRLGGDPQRVPRCRLTCTDEVFGKRSAAKASMLAGESARASKMPARQPMAYSPRGGPPV